MNPKDEPKLNTPKPEIQKQENAEAESIFGIQFGQSVTFGRDALGGIIVKDSAGVPILKMNENAFITTFEKAFAASSNTNGAFGDDWFQFFCEQDSIDTNVAGVIELPSTNRMLIKRSGSGAELRIQGSTNRTGMFDIFEPIALPLRTTAEGDPADPSGWSGTVKMYFRVTAGTLSAPEDGVIRIYTGSVGGWKTITPL